MDGQYRPEEYRVLRFPLEATEICASPGGSVQSRTSSKRDEVLRYLQRYRGLSKRLWGAAQAITRLARRATILRPHRKLLKESVKRWPPEILAERDAQKKWARARAAGFGGVTGQEIAHLMLEGDPRYRAFKTPQARIEEHQRQQKKLQVKITEFGREAPVVAWQNLATSDLRAQRALGLFQSKYDPPRSIHNVHEIDRIIALLTPISRPRPGKPVPIALSPKVLGSQRKRLVATAQERWLEETEQKIPFSWVHRAAGVGHKEAYRWLSGDLSENSSITTNIERILQGSPPPKKLTPK